jgi:hypothetical protein
MEIMSILILVACGDVLMCYWASFFFLDRLTLKIEALQFFKMFGYTRPVTWRHIPEDLILRQYHCDNLRMHLQVVPTGEEG